MHNYKVINSKLNQENKLRLKDYKKKLEKLSQKERTGKRLNSSLRDNIHVNEYIIKIQILFIILLEPVLLITVSFLLIFYLLL